VKDEPEQRSKLSYFFKSFEFVLACVLLVFLAVGFVLVQSLLRQPNYLRGVVWEDQFDEANFDYNFETPHESYEVDLSLWRPVADRHRAFNTSIVRQTISRDFIKKDGQNEYLMSVHTSGLKPDFICLTHPFRFTQDFSLDKPFGAEKLVRYTAKIDISDEPAGELIRVEIIIYSWNAFQGTQNQMYGVYAKPKAESLSINLILPEDRIVLKGIVLERYDSDTSEMRRLSKGQVTKTQALPRRVGFTIDDPKSWDGYFVRWRQKTP